MKPDFTDLKDYLQTYKSGEHTMKGQLLLVSALEAIQATVVSSATIYLAGDSTMAPGGGGTGTQGTHHT